MPHEQAKEGNSVLPGTTEESKHSRCILTAVTDNGVTGQSVGIRLKIDEQDSSISFTEVSKPDTSFHGVHVRCTQGHQRRQALLYLSLCAEYRCVFYVITEKDRGFSVSE